MFLCSDWAYEGVYDNSQDSNSFKSAKGFSYHQGPVCFQRVELNSSRTELLFQYFIRTQRVLLRKTPKRGSFTLESKSGTLVKALSNVLRVRVPVDHVIFGLILLLVLALVPEKLFSGNFGFLLSSKIVISKFYFVLGYAR